MRVNICNDNGQCHSVDSFLFLHDEELKKAYTKTIEKQCMKSTRNCLSKFWDLTISTVMIGVRAAALTTWFPSCSPDSITLGNPSAAPVRSRK